MQELLSVAIPIVLVHVVILVVLVLGIRLVLRATASKAVARVRQVEEEVRKQEEELHREKDRLERELADRKAESERQIEALRDEAKREAVHAKEKALSEAKKDAQKIIDQAKANEKKLREQIEREMEDKAVDYGGQIFKLVFSDLVNAELNQIFTGELVDALNEIEPGSITVDTGEALISTSHTLSEETRSRLEKVLREKFHEKAEIRETIDEELMSGIVLKMGSLEIDGSLRNRYQEAVREVQKAVAHRT